MPKLTPNPNNPRTISKEAFEQLKGKIQRNPDGLSANKIVYKDGVIIAGNQRWRAIQDLKLEVKDDWLKDVSGWTDEQIREYLVTSNISDGDWDWDTLLNEYDPQELDDWGLEVPGLEDDKEIEEDEAPEVTEDPVSELGKIYQLGKHRVMCGDSTDKSSTDDLFNGNKVNLVFTDPPYGIDVVNDDMVGADFGVAKKGKYEKVINDDTTDTAEKFYHLTRDYSHMVILWGGNYFTKFLPFSDGWLIWDKRGDSGIRNTFADGEMAWCSFHTPIRIYTQLWNGMIREGEKEKRVHPTQKPLNTLASIISDFSDETDLVYDGFLGSGSTLIACEQTDRICYGMELDPKYVDVIRKRYAKFTQPDNQLPENWEELTPEVTND